MKKNYLCRMPEQIINNLSYFITAAVPKKDKRLLLLLQIWTLLPV